MSVPACPAGAARRPSRGSRTRSSGAALNAFCAAVAASSTSVLAPCAACRLGLVGADRRAIEQPLRDRRAEVRAQRERRRIVAGRRERFSASRSRVSLSAGSSPRATSSGVSTGAAGASITGVITGGRGIGHGRDRRGIGRRLSSPVVLGLPDHEHVDHRRRRRRSRAAPSAGSTCRRASHAARGAVSSSSSIEPTLPVLNPASSLGIIAHAAGERGLVGDRRQLAAERALRPRGASAPWPDAVGRPRGGAAIAGRQRRTARSFGRRQRAGLRRRLLRRRRAAAGSAACAMTAPRARRRRGRRPVVPEPIGGVFDRCTAVALAAAVRAGTEVVGGLVASTGRIAPPAAEAPMPSIVLCTSWSPALPGVLVVRSSRVVRASSAIVKYWLSSVMSPRRFHVLPVREISDSRVTTPPTIHCCSVASSRQLFCSPFSSRISHCRSSVGSSVDRAAVRPSSSTDRLESARRGCSAEHRAWTTPACVARRRRTDVGVRPLADLEHVTAVGALDRDPTGLQTSFVELVLGLALLAADVHGRGSDGHGTGVVSVS